MVVIKFPPVEEANDYGLVAVGGDLDVSSLLLAYQSGIFPWPMFGERYLTWFSPAERALLFLNEFIVPRSLRKALKRGNYSFRINSNFSSVINQCAELVNRPGQDGTWITPSIVEAYIQLHSAGYAHSIECYREEQLVGGLYGVSIGGMFAGESMFYREANASKLTLWFLVEYLRAHGVLWIDCQFRTPLFESFGARDVAREEFLELLKEALSAKVRLFAARAEGRI